MKNRYENCRDVIVSKCEERYCCYKYENKDYYLKNIYLSVLEDIGNKDIQKEYKGNFKRILNNKFISLLFNRYLNYIEKKRIKNKYEKIHKI